MNLGRTNRNADESHWATKQGLSKPGSFTYLTAELSLLWGFLDHFHAKWEN